MERDAYLHKWIATLEAKCNWVNPNATDVNHAHKVKLWIGWQILALGVMAVLKHLDAHLAKVIIQLLELVILSHNNKFQYVDVTRFWILQQIGVKIVLLDNWEVVMEQNAINIHLQIL